MVSAMLDVLRAELAVQDVFGDPARIFDDETDAPAFPYARVERHEVNDAGAALVHGAEHKITLMVASRHDGLVGARKALRVVRDALGAAELTVPGARIVLSHVTYADTMRRSDRTAYRGLIRFRVIAEEAI